MVRLLIEDITIRKGEQIQLDVRFRADAFNVEPLISSCSLGCCSRFVLHHRISTSAIESADAKPLMKIVNPG
jgi:hypothetical protein